MKIILSIFLVFLNYSAFCQFSCGNSDDSENHSSSGTIYCGDNPSNTGIRGNFMYIPGEQHEELAVQVNVHVMQFSEGDPRNFTSDDIPYLESIVENGTATEVYNRVGTEEICFGSPTSAPESIDSKIRLIVNQVYFHIDSIGWKNGEEVSIDSDGNVTVISSGKVNTYCRQNYVDPNPEVQNYLNIFLCEPPHTSGGGWGPGYSSEDASHVIMTGQLSNSSWNFAREIAHEVNHCLGLYHSWSTAQMNIHNDYVCNPGSDFNGNSNHNMAYNGAQIYLSPLQVAHMRRQLYISWRKKYIHDEVQEPTYEINENTLVDNTVIWVEDIIVKTGAELKISGTLQMNPGKKIVVEKGGKLTLDGGTISSCDDHWKGIVNHGTVSIEGIVNEIENAEIAIDVKRGAELNIEYNTFAFIPTLYIRDCSVNAIRAVDPAQIHAVEVEFINCNQAIILTYPSGNASAAGQMVVDDCKFVDNSEDLKVVSASGMNPVLISNNSFSGLIGVNMNGDNAYDIRGNNFSGQSIWSTFLYSTGLANSNSYSGNDVASLGYGIVAVEDNTRFQFLANCFEGNVFGDLIVNGMFGDQGTQTVANSNCFSQDAIADIAAFTNGTPFTYWEPKEILNLDQCVYSTTNTPDGYTSIQDADNGFLTPCNSGNSNSNGWNTPNDLCDVGDNPTDINNEINNIHSLIADIDQHPFNSQRARLSEEQALNRCLIKLYNQLANYYYQNGLVNDAVNVYQNHPLFEMQIKGYFLLIDDGQYTSARNYLNGLNTVTNDQSNFRQSSLAYLAAIEQGETYELSQEDENNIYDAALSPSPLAGYSRSIWMHFRGEDIRMNVTLPSGQSAPRSKLVSESMIHSYITPNPASVELFIRVAGLNESTYNFELFDINGRIVERKAGLRTDHKLDISNFDSGLYFCRIVDAQTEIIDMHKIYIE